MCDMGTEKPNRRLITTLAARNEVPFTMDDAGTVRVAPEHACGMVLRFAEQSN